MEEEKMIKPYFETELGKLYCGDCLDIMPEFPDNYFDLCLTDPPYELENHGGGKSKMWRQICDKHIDFISNGFEIIALDIIDKKIKIMNCLLFCSNKQISKQMFYFENKQYSTTLLIWKKTNPVPFGNGKYISDAEFIIYARGKGAIYNNDVKDRKKIFEYPYPSIKNRIHPTEKPKELLEKLLKIHSKENDLIIDPFAGGCTTAVACEKLGRRWVGIEMEEKYCEIAAKRIEAKARQYKLNL